MHACPQDEKRQRPHGTWRISETAYGTLVRSTQRTLAHGDRVDHGSSLNRPSRSKVDLILNPPGAWLVLKRCHGLNKLCIKETERKCALDFQLHNTRTGWWPQRLHNVNNSKFTFLDTLRASIWRKQRIDNWKDSTVVPIQHLLVEHQYGLNAKKETRSKCSQEPIPFERLIRSCNKIGNPCERTDQALIPNSLSYLIWCWDWCWIPLSS